MLLAQPVFVDSKLMLPIAATQNYTEKFNKITKDQLTDVGQEICAAFGQDMAPLTLIAEEGEYQKALASYVFPDETNPRKYILKWDRKTEIPLDDYTTDVDVYDLVQPPVKIIIVTLKDMRVAFPFQPKDILKGGGETYSMKELEIKGGYNLQSVKLVKTKKFGLKNVLTIDGKQYWANSGMLDKLGIRKLLPEREGEVKELNLKFRVFDKQESSGKTVVKFKFE